MSCPSLRTEDLVLRILAAFPDPGFSPEELITGHRCWECDEIQEHFRFRPIWKGHKVCDLRQHEAALSLFTPKAFAYFLPAFLEAALTDPEAADVILDGIVFHAERIAKRDGRDELLSAKQLLVLADCVTWIESVYDAQAEIPKSVAMLRALAAARPEDGSFRPDALPSRGEFPD